MWWEGRLVAVRDNGRSVAVATPWVALGLLEATGERVFGNAGAWTDSIPAELVGRYESSLRPGRPWLASPDGRAALVAAERTSQLVRHAPGLAPMGLGELIFAVQAAASPRFAVLEADRVGSFRERVVHLHLDGREGLVFGLVRGRS